jgi:methionine-R-sulfoxide reductase
MKRYLILTMLSVMSLFASCQTKTDPNTKTSKSMEDKNAQFPVQKTEEEWKKQLTPEQYYVIRQKGTERPHTGKYDLTFEKGVYSCAACGQELFNSDSKFNAHCGWPSFDSEIGKGRIKYITDKTLGMTRTEIVCAKCGGHLGHVFDDGPTSTGQRYCVNSISIDFKKDE